MKRKVQLCKPFRESRIGESRQVAIIGKWPWSSVTETIEFRLYRERPIKRRSMIVLQEFNIREGINKLRW